jgi:hypothetical protein
VAKGKTDKIPFPSGVETESKKETYVNIGRTDQFGRS